MGQSFLYRSIQALFSKLPVSYHWLVIFSILLASFQNCSPLNNSVSGDAKSQSSPKLKVQDSGNGEVYGQLLPPVMPGMVQPGQKVVVAVLGGTGPFVLKSQNEVGQITRIEERKFIWEIPSTARPQKDVLNVHDALSNQAGTPVEIQFLKQDDSISSFGKSAVSVKGFTIMGAEDSSHQINRLGCVKSGYLQIFNSQGGKSSQVFPDPKLCDQFGAQLSTDGERVVASGIINEPRSDSTWSQQAGVTIYQMTNEGILIPEQTIISKRRLAWSWVSVGLRKDRLFIAYASDAQTGLVVEIYKKDEEGWRPAYMLDFANSANYDTSQANSNDGHRLVKFSETSSDIIVQTSNRANSQRTYLVFKESLQSQWLLQEAIVPFELIPQEIRDLGTEKRVSNFQIQNDTLVISVHFANVDDLSSRERVLIFKKSSRGVWAFQQVVAPTWANQSENAVLTSLISGNSLVVYHEVLHRLEVYRKRGNQFELYVDLSDVLMQSGFARSARFSEKKIIVPYNRSAYVFSLE